MRTPEGRVKDAVKAFLDEQPECWYYMPVPMGRGKSGLDFIGCSRGRCFMIETKAPGGKETKRQELCRRDAEKAECKVFVIYGERKFNDPEWLEIGEWFAY